MYVLLVVDRRYQEDLVRDSQVVVAVLARLSVVRKSYGVRCASRK
jgi:hypothetical protein